MQMNWLINNLTNSVLQRNLSNRTFQVLLLLQLSRRQAETDIGLHNDVGGRCRLRWVSCELQQNSLAQDA